MYDIYIHNIIRHIIYFEVFKRLLDKFKTSILDSGYRYLFFIFKHIGSFSIHHPSCQHIQRSQRTVISIYDNIIL